MSQRLRPRYMIPVERPDLEANIRSLSSREHWSEALTAAVEGYGPEIHGFIRALLKSDEDAAEIYAETCAALWSGLRSFQWKSSFRTWAYAIANNTCRRHLRHPRHRRERP